MIDREPRYQWPAELKPISAPLCGPYAIALAAVRPLDEVFAQAQSILGRAQQWRGRIQRGEIITLMRSLDVPFRVLRDCQGKSLAETLKDLDFGSQFLVNITGHYVIVLDGLIFDQHFPLGEPIATYRWRRRSVRRVFEILSTPL